MAFDVEKYPLAVAALSEIDSLYKAQGLEFKRDEFLQHASRAMEVLAQYTDGSAQETESKIAATILIMGGPNTMHSRDISGYAEKFNGLVASYMQEIHDIVDESPASKNSKGVLQIIAAHQLSAYEHYMGFIKTNPEFYDLNSEEPRNKKFAEHMKENAWNEGRFAADYPKGIDLGAPRLKKLIQDETSAFYAEFNKLNNIGGGAAPAPKDKGLSLA